MNGLGNTLGMTGRQTRELGIIVAGFTLQSFMGWILVPRLGQMGAAMASFVTVVFICLARLWVIYRQFGIVPVALSAFFPIILACAIAFSIYHALLSKFDRTIVATAFECFAVAAVYAACVIIFGVFAHRFRRFLNRAG
jgi:hypothetical protein